MVTTNGYETPIEQSRVFSCSPACRNSRQSRLACEIVHALAERTGPDDLRWTWICGCKQLTPVGVWQASLPTCSYELVSKFPQEYRGAISNKRKLAMNIRSYFGTSGPPCGGILPETYDLQCPLQLMGFLVDFSVGRAVAALRFEMHAMETQVISNTDTSKSALKVGTISRLLHRLALQAKLNRRCLLEGFASWNALQDRGVHLRLEEIELLLAPSAVLPDDVPRPKCASVATAKDTLSLSVALGEGRRWLEALSQAGGDSIGDISLGDVGKVWLLKLPGRERGEGVQVHLHLMPMLLEAKRHSWKVIIQRYIPRPLLVNGRKCDARLFVLISSWTPAVCWIYTECYLRVAAKCYEFNACDIANPLMHLTNINIQREAACEDVEGNRWSLTEFFDWADSIDLVIECPGCRPLNARDAWKSYTWPKICEAVRGVVQACQIEKDNHPKGCFELFGFDFLFEETMRPWLLEVNSGPDQCRKAGPNIRRLYNRMFEEMLSLVSAVHASRVHLPCKYGSMDESIHGAGGWRLVFQECPLQKHDISQQGLPPILAPSRRIDSQRMVLQEWFSEALNCGVSLDLRLQKLLGRSGSRAASRLQSQERIHQSVATRRAQSLPALREGRISAVVADLDDLQRKMQTRLTDMGSHDSKPAETSQDVSFGSASGQIARDKARGRPPRSVSTH